MNLFSQKDIRDLLKKYGVYPSKKLGQNFLVDKSAFQKIIEAANLTKRDIVLEVGPGIGNLTQELAKKAGMVIAVEKDQKLIRVLNNELRIKNVEVIWGDILKLLNPKSEIRNPKQILNFKFKIPKIYKVVANLPYYITSPVIRNFLESKKLPKLMVLMVQKEVAQRICAKPPKMSLLSVSVQFYAKPEITSYISKKSFWPMPEVDSAIIKISNIKKDPPGSKQQKSKIDTNLFFKVVKAGFSQPRKQLVNNLNNVLKLNKDEVASWLIKNKVNPARRAETLSIEDWIRLTESFKIK